MSTTLPGLEGHPPFSFQLQPRFKYLYVKVEGKMTTREQMLAYQGGIAEAMVPGLGKRLMVDGRDAERPLIELRAEMWTWMGETPHVKRIAIIANEEKTTKRVERSADVNRIRVAGFHSIEDGEEWLLRDIDPGKTGS